MVIQGFKTGEVVLVCSILQARSVNLVGNFNNWRELPMTRAADGTFRTKLRLGPGTYYYQFVVDGRARRDPDGFQLSSKSCSWISGFEVYEDRPRDGCFSPLTVPTSEK